MQIFKEKVPYSREPVSKEGLKNYNEKREGQKNLKGKQ